MVVNEEEEDYSEDEEDDGHYKMGGKRGFNTNIDDFIMAFDNIVEDSQKK